MIQARQRSQNREYTAIVLQRHAARHFDPLAIYPPVPIRENAAIIGPMSSGTPARPSAVISAIRSLTSGLSRTIPPLKSVWIAPGATALAVIRRVPEFFRHITSQNFDGSVSITRNVIGAMCSIDGSFAVCRFDLHKRQLSSQFEAFLYITVLSSTPRPAADGDLRASLEVGLIAHSLTL
jgi:hypothetical protein